MPILGSLNQSRKTKFVRSVDQVLPDLLVTLIKFVYYLFIKKKIRGKENSHANFASDLVLF